MNRLNRDTGGVGGRGAGFTLVELLTVIVIIAVLAALLLPSLSYGRKLARIRKAKTEAVHLAKAWETYWDAYEDWPSAFGASFDMEADKVAVLLGLDDNLNTNKLKLMEFPKRAQNEGFLDPWKQPYWVVRTGDTYPLEQEYWSRAQMVNGRRYAHVK